jgi:hypothetical protein
VKAFDNTMMVTQTEVYVLRHTNIESLAAVDMLANEHVDSPIAVIFLRLNPCQESPPKYSFPLFVTDTVDVICRLQTLCYHHYLM